MKDENADDDTDGFDITSLEQKHKYKNRVVCTSNEKNNWLKQ